MGVTLVVACFTLADFRPTESIAVQLRVAQAWRSGREHPPDSKNTARSRLTRQSRAVQRVVCDSPATLTQPRPKRDVSLTTVRARTANVRPMRVPRANSAGAARDSVWWFARPWHPAPSSSDLNAAASIERQASTSSRVLLRAPGNEVRMVPSCIDLLNRTNPVESFGHHR